MNYVYSVSGIFSLALAFVSGMLYESYSFNHKVYSIGQCVRKLGHNQIYKVNLVVNQNQIELTYPNKNLKGGLGYQLQYSKNLVKVNCDK